MSPAIKFFKYLFFALTTNFVTCAVIALIPKLVGYDAPGSIMVGFFVGPALAVGIVAFRHMTAAIVAGIISFAANYIYLIYLACIIYLRCL